MAILIKGIGAKITHRPIEKKIIKSLVDETNNTRKRLKKLLNRGNIATGYVPYCLNQTKIFYYNFFSINYGLRSNIDLVVSLVDCNFEPIESKYFSLSHRQHLNLDATSLFSKHINKNATFIVIFILNKKIPFNHGGAGGHLRFFGIWNHFSSFCHSWPLPGTYEILKGWLSSPYKRLSERRFYPSSAFTVSHYGPFTETSEINERGDLSTSLEMTHGFTMLKDHKNLIRTLFHNKKLDRKIRLKEQKSSVKHIVSIPPVKGLDIELYFGECCTNGSEFLINHYAFSQDDNKSRILLFSTNYKVDLDSSVKISTLIDINQATENDGSWVEFISLTGKHSWYYLNLIYYLQKGNLLCDATHSHPFTDIKKSNKLSRTLKFAPLKYKSTKLDNSFNRDTFIAMWSDINVKLNARLRIFSVQKSNFEIVFPIEIPPSSVLHLKLNNYLDNYFEKYPIDFGKDFVVQLESEMTNIPANLYHHNKNNPSNTFAVDHFTGG